jgi:hypothetical protein
MIRLTNESPKVMEFTSFTKKEDVTDDELLFALSKFENALSKQKGIIFHCLMRNFSNEYANVLFASDMSDLKELEKKIGKHEDVIQFFELIEMTTTKIEFHEILDNNFIIPSSFSCIEKGLFSLKNKEDKSELVVTSLEIEENYLSTFSNTKAHFIGEIKENEFSEITIGETFGTTKQICMGYLENESCKKMLGLIDESTMQLDFWYLIA